MRPTGTPQQLEDRRILAMRLIEKGKSKAEIADILGTSRMSVNRWFQSFQKKGKSGLAPKKASGRPQKLSSKEKAKLLKLLLKGPLALGYATDLWTLERISDMMQKKMGVEYHPRHVWRILRKMNWTCQKPERRALQRNEKEIENWKRYKWPHIKKRSTTWRPLGV
jgi:transposase